MKLILPNAQPVDDTDPVAKLDDLTSPETSELFTVTQVFAFDLGTETRSDSVTEPETRDVGDDVIVEVVFEDGSQWYLGPDELAELEAAQPIGRSGGVDGLLMDDALFAYGAQRVDAEASRGIIKSVAKRIRAFSVNLVDGLAGKVKDLVSEQSKGAVVDQLGALAIDPAAYYLARRLEKRNDTQGNTRLCQVRFDGSDVRLQPLNVPAERLPSDKPVLIMLHGTLSSTRGSFGDLWKTRATEFQKLLDHYDGAVYALEHNTLTESPISNALLIAEAMADKCELDLLSHSRGGLVGEILCRGSRQDQQAFSTDERALYVEQSQVVNGFDLKNQVTRQLTRYFEQETSRFERLNTLLSERDITISRFVRVACPARGTTLASGKLHRWSNRAFNAGKLLTGGPLNPAVKIFQEFTLGVLKANTKPEVLPGLQAMMPSSALIHVLNKHDVSVPADLSIVAGDVELDGGLNWKKIPLWISDKFFGGEHDLVVNTASMDGGAQREQGIRELKVIGAHVNHFSYFQNADSANQVIQRFTTGSPLRFESKAQLQDVFIPRSRPSRHEFNRPVLVLVPGILGSELRHEDKDVWINAFRLALGGMSHLADPAARDVTTGEVVNRAYGDFIAHFGNSHDVYTVPYDWRNSLSDAATVLRKQLQEILDRQSENSEPQPIRIVAHSMGGLVARMMIANHSGLWQQVISRVGSRLIMAGTPNNGSYSVNRILSGELKLIKLLALADIRNSRKDLTAIAAGFPGVATLLPGFGTLEWMQDATWGKVEGMPGMESLSRVDESLLTKARLERQLIQNSPIDNQHMSYVAGQSAWTPSDVIVEGSKLSFIDTSAGDGQVTWDDGIPTNLDKDNVFYQPSPHGSLLATPGCFEAWEELLATGATQRLETTPPVGIMRGGRGPATRSVTDDDPIDYLPDESTLIELALGMAPASMAADAPVAASRIGVSVTHGNLSFARFPVAVGHYKDESILHAEKVLDRELDFNLSLRHSIGQYPGPIGTSTVVFARSHNAIPEGALVVGLGDLGRLSLGKLETAMTQAMVNYLLEFNDWLNSRSNHLNDRGSSSARDSILSSSPRQTVGLSVLLVGSSVGSLSVEDSVGAILRAAVAANRVFEQPSSAEGTRVLEHIELIELYQDLALEAAHAVAVWQEKIKGHPFDVKDDVQESGGGLRRARFANSSDWWHTISVKQSADVEAFIYEDYSRNAYTELSDEPVEMAFIDRFIDKVVSTPRFDREQSGGPHQALFELLLPNGIKERAPDSDKLRLMLDEASARVPWEMLVDGWSIDREPLVASKQVIRQLSIDQSRQGRAPARGNKALVIGDPPSGNDGYLPLISAREEARQVADLLRLNRMFDVTQLIAGDDTDNADEDMALKIVQALCADEYQILHCAAHGSYRRETGSDPAAADQSLLAQENAEEGMVIGEGLRLTPTLVQKMRRVPAVVFLNCCHLGAIEQRTAATKVRFNHIAANLATQFIKMGAKVVVAAGWEVMDKPAGRFAEVFYNCLLDNKSLADCISSARRTVYQEYSDSNTFGAYQCWGDPEFRLLPRSPEMHSGPRDCSFKSSEECVVEALNLRNEAMTASGEGRKPLLRRANALKRHVWQAYGNPNYATLLDIDQWTRPRVRTLSGLGRAYGELGEISTAIRLLRHAYRLNPSAVGVRDLEQLANFECRHAVALCGADQDDDIHGIGPGDVVDNAVAKECSSTMLEKGQCRLEDLLLQHQSSRSPTSQRDIHCLVGGGYKRQVMHLAISTPEIGKSNRVATRATLVEALQHMRHHYGMGWAGDTESLSASPQLADYIDQAGFNHAKPESYAFMNFALATVVLPWFEPKARTSRQSKSTSKKKRGKAAAQSPDEQRTDNTAVFPANFYETLRAYTEEGLSFRQRHSNFWQARQLCDCFLVQSLDDDIRQQVGIFPETFDFADEMIAVYESVVKRFGSYRQWSSECDQIRFVLDMYAMRAKFAGRKSMPPSEQPVEVFSVAELPESDLTPEEKRMLTVLRYLEHYREGETPAEESSTGT